MSLKISIITVTYNSEATLAQTIRSVINQTYPNIEYIIVDGQSTDKTAEIVKSFGSRVSVYVSEKDNGLYDAINKGIKLATGDVIGLLHSDDFYTSPAIIEKYARLFEEKKSDAVYADLFYVDKDNTDKIVRTWKSGKYKPGGFLFGWMPPHPTFFVKRQVYEKLGLYRTDFKTAADYELMLRVIHKNGIMPDYLPEFAINMRTGGKSNINVGSRLNANLEDRRAWEVNDLKPRFYTLYLKPLRKLRQFF